jgi:hypothetical protein
MEYAWFIVSKKFYFIAHVWLILTVLLGILAVSGCLVVPDNGGGGHHDDDHQDDHGPVPYGVNDHPDPNQHNDQDQH